MEQNEDLRQLYEKLIAPFIKTVGGKIYPDLKWKPQSKVGNDRVVCVPYLDRFHAIDRLNECFGIDGWQFTPKREADGSRTGDLSCLINGKWISRGDTGTEQTVEGGKVKDKIEKEKAATSDALKRCAEQFGIGTYLKKIPSMIIDAKLNNNNKLTPVDKKGRFLYKDHLSAYCNGMSGEQGILAQLLTMRRDLWDREEIKKLWAELAM